MERTEYPRMDEGNKNHSQVKKSVMCVEQSGQSRSVEETRGATKKNLGIFFFFFQKDAQVTQWDLQ